MKVLDWVTYAAILGVVILLYRHFRSFIGPDKD